MHSELGNEQCHESFTKQHSNMEGPNRPHLPTDFRLHLQLLERMLQQELVLNQVLERQQLSETQISGLYKHVDTVKEETRRQVGEQTDTLLAAIKEWHVEVTGLLHTHHEDMQSFTSTCTTNLWRQVDDCEHNNSEMKGCTPDDVHQNCATDDELPDSDDEDFHRGPPNAPTSMFTTCSTREISGSWIQNIVKSRYFDILSATIIVLNAATISVTAEQSIKYALGNIGSSYADGSFLMKTASFFFAAFYACELLLRMYVFRLSFFVGSDWKWNALDIVLVVTGIYDIISAVVQFGSGANMTWIRLLRLLKMLKMLRVVRVMRFFKELRLMIASIVGSIATLFWSILMLTLMMYIFGLCFLQAVTGYLEESSATSVDQETVNLIKSYWSSVLQATISLYMAITGGCDWEQLAKPLKDAGELYYFLFLFYISFAAVAVLNVLTGMFVDAAMKVSDNEEGSVLAEIMEAEREIFQNFERLVVQQGPPRRTGLIKWNQLYQYRHKSEVKDFLKCLEITMDDAKKVYKMMEQNGSVKFDEFLIGCSKVKDDIKTLDMVAISCDHQRAHIQMSVLMQYIQERFDEVHKLFEMLGAPSTRIETLRSRLSRAHCLPEQWDNA